MKHTKPSIETVLIVAIFLMSALSFRRSGRARETLTPVSVISPGNLIPTRVVLLSPDGKLYVARSGHRGGETSATESVPAPTRTITAAVKPVRLSRIDWQFARPHRQAKACCQARSGETLGPSGVAIILASLSFVPSRWWW